MISQKYTWVDEFEFEDEWIVLARILKKSQTALSSTSRKKGKENVFINSCDGRFLLQANLFSSYDLWSVDQNN
jgi:hypothetical protein